MVTRALLIASILSWGGSLLGAEGEVRILHPSGQEAVFGEVPFVVDAAGAAVASVELLVDGRSIARLEKPPFEGVADVGQENVAHRFEALVVYTSGQEERLVVKTPAIHVDEVVELNLQQIFVTVTGSSGGRRLGLTKEHFELRDDGRRQDLVTVASGKIPFTAVVLLDGSISMEGDQGRAARAGLSYFAEGMRENDEARLLVFGDHLLAASPFTQDAEVLAAPLDGYFPPGGTAIYDHLYLALRLLEPRLGRRVVILLSDGRDVHSVLRMKEIRRTARRSQAMLYWVETPRPGAGRGLYAHSFLPPEEIEAERQRLATSVRETGGRILLAESPAQIRAALGEILQELREQHALGYYPDPPGAGRWRPLKVKVHRRGLKVRAPEGYFSPPTGTP